LAYHREKEITMGGVGPRKYSVQVSREGDGFNYSIGNCPEGEELVAVVEHWVDSEGNYKLFKIETLCPLIVIDFAIPPDRNTISLLSVRNCIMMHRAAKKVRLEA
jgi:hypothetical protein